MKSKHPIPLLFRSDIGPAREATDVSDERHQQPVKKKQVKSSNYKCIIEEKKLYEMIVLTTRKLLIIIFHMIFMFPSWNIFDISVVFSE